MAEVSDGRNHQREAAVRKLELFILRRFGDGASAAWSEYEIIENYATTAYLASLSLGGEEGQQLMWQALENLLQEGLVIRTDEPTRRPFERALRSNRSRG